MYTTIFFMIIAYLLGSLSSAIIVCKLLDLPDPRTEGSKNPGATNVLRFADKQTALIVLAGDVAKGLVAVLIARIFGVDGFALGMVGLAAFLGHLFPVYFHFKGGKGVATALGVIAGLAPVVALLIGLVWFGMAYKFRYSSLAALVAATLAPFLCIWFSDSMYFIPLIIMSVILAWRHWGNIVRLMEGTEPKIGETKPEDASESKA